MKENLRLNPSNFRLWANCGLSVDERLNFTNYVPTEDNTFDDTDYTTIGKKMHEVAAVYLKNGMADFSDLTEQQKDNIKSYCSLVKSLCKSNKLYIETKVFIEEIACFGVVDSFFYDEETKDLFIFDLKTGVGHKIFAYNPDPEERHHMNGQLLLYALGCCSALEKPVINNIHLYISQHSLNNTDHFTISYERLMKWKEEVLLPILNDFEKGNMKANPGSWCEDRHCSKKETCVIHMRNILEKTLAKLPTTNFLSDMNSNEYSDLIDNITGLNNIYSNIRINAVERLKEGGEIKDYSISKPSRMIKSENEQEVLNRLTAYGINQEELIKQSLVGLMEIDKLTEGKTEELIGDLISCKETNKLVKMN